MMAVCEMTLGRPRFVRAVGTDSAGLVECDPLAYDRVELRQFQTVRRVAADACQGRFDADAVDGLHSFDTDGQRDVTAERGNQYRLVCRFGLKRRRVFLCEWDTRLPVEARVPRI